jgi:6-pyruvoyltetrahydropterin/6-carboxytetrahydropterin synthase
MIMLPKSYMHREYKLKFYLNAQHYVTFHGKRGQTHPHTWEFCLNIKMPRSEFVPFDAFEEKINKYFARLQNTVLNDVEPFTEIEPTLENMVDLFAAELYEVVAKIGGRLAYVEGSEGPTRSYITRIESGVESEILEVDANHAIDSYIDQLIDNSMNGQHE